ncbi:MAG TPA: hypothetical protein VK627_10415 [Edaphobacter sp.]|nr:hypothetical protein [Edaphobacter sp.]
MTWHTFFDFSTMSHRHLVFVYVGVWIVQGSYLAWMLRQWTRTKAPHA